MVKKCAWGLCNSDTRYPERQEGGIRFIPFPKPRRSVEKCKRWIKACGRPHEQLNINIVDGNRHLFVCTKHFVDGAPSERYPDPVPASLPQSAGTGSAPTRHCPTKRAASEPAARKRSRKLLALPGTSWTDENAGCTSGNCATTAEGQGKTSPRVSGPPEAAPDLELLALAAENRKLQEELLRQQSHVQQLQQAYAVRILQNEALRKQIAEQTRREAKQRRGFKQLRKT